MSLLALGKAIATDRRSLVYGGGTEGMMGVISKTVADAGGSVIGVVPYAMRVAGGEKEKVALDVGPDARQPSDNTPVLTQVTTILVDSMHDRKIEIAKRADGFIGLPGGFGTFEEILEAITWTQLGIYNKPVVLANIQGYWDPLRQLIHSAIGHAYIQPGKARIVVFVDGPADHADHENYDWGNALLQAFDNWTEIKGEPMFDWSRRSGDSMTEAGKLTAA
ncbi:hypothetical protein APHAL10511_001271 [Amanita phalloides]|nr:hypothetical protein APHAL10511_001271 [Amanita phalloides]